MQGFGQRAGFSLRFRTTSAARRCAKGFRGRVTSRPWLDFVCLRPSRTALWCCASSHQATGVQASRPCRAPIADASGRPGLRAALALLTPAFVVGLACCSLHPCTPFSPSRSARPVVAGGRSAVFEPVTAALRRAGSGLGQSRPITGVGHGRQITRFAGAAALSGVRHCF